MRFIKKYLSFSRIKTIARAFIGLDESNINSDPFKQFELWFQDAVNAGLTLPEAMTLSTVSSDNKPSARVVLLKDFSANSSTKGGTALDSFVFYTNYESVKAKEISGNPYVALTFYWAELNQQVRIEGKLERTSSEESDDYFNTRPRGSQIGAWASPQSNVIPDRKFIKGQVEHFEKKFKGQVVPRPPHWGGYCLKPNKIQFWQARADRLHDRILYSLQEDGNWKIERLAP